MKKLRVAMFHGAGVCLNIEKAAGVEVAELNELRYLPAQAIEPVLYARWLNGKPTGLVHQLSKKIPARGWARPFGRKERIFWDFVFWFKCKRYDILHIHSHVTGGLFSPNRSLVHIHNLDVGDWYGYPTFTPGLTRLHFVFLSKYLRNAFLKCHAKVKKEQTFVVYSGVDLQAFNVNSRPGENELPRIAYLSQWSKNKGLFVLLEALKQVQSLGHKFTLVLAGDPGMCALYSSAMQKEIREKVNAEIKQLHNVEMPGYVSHNSLPALLETVQMVVVPSVWEEPYGIVAAEAQAAGLPVIITRVGGLVESTVDDKTGIVVEPDDPRGLAAAIIRLLANRNLRAEMGMSGRARARKYFGWEHHAEEIRKIYDHILENPGHTH